MLQMGVKRIFLEAAYRKAKSVWTSSSFAFSVIKNVHDFKRLAMQYTLVQNAGVAGRCIKLTPTHAALVEQVSLADIPAALCHAQ